MKITYHLTKSGDNIIPHVVCSNADIMVIQYLLKIEIRKDPEAKFQIEVSHDLPTDKYQKESGRQGIKGMR